MRNYLIAMTNANKIHTGVFTLPNDYEFLSDIKMNSHSAKFNKLKEIMYNQIDGFHECHWSLHPENRDGTKIISISKLD